jgi:hypothetical protein
VTSFPSEACEHADAIFIGPWDGAFKTFIDDYQHGKKRRLYCAPTTRADLGKTNDDRLEFINQAS